MYNVSIHLEIVDVSQREAFTQDEIVESVQHEEKIQQG